MASFQLTDIQHVPASIEVDDGAGNPVAAPAGAVTWGTSDASILTVTPSADGTSADIAATGPLGTAQVTVSVQLDPNDPKSTITGSADITVVASAASTIKLNFGTPTNK